MSGPDFFSKKDEKPKTSFSKAKTKPTDKDGPDFWKKAPTKKLSNKHEAAVADMFSAKVVPGSGNIAGKPGDVQDSEFLHECKATENGGIYVQGKWLKKITLEALVSGKIPLLDIRIEGLDSTTPKDWVLIPSNEFAAVLEKLKEKGA